MLEEGLGTSPVEVSGDRARYELADGTRLEAYSETDEYHGFFTTGPVVGFTVEDFDESRGRLAQLGIEALTEMQEADGQKWVHFRLPGGTIAELIGGTRPA